MMARGIFASSRDDDGDENLPNIIDIFLYQGGKVIFMATELITGPEIITCYGLRETE